MQAGRRPRNGEAVDQCRGRCARTIRRIITDALGPCARGCVAGCEHQKSQAFPELQIFPELMEEEGVEG